MDEQTRLSACPRCGRALAPDAPHDLCPACLLAAANESLTRGADETATVSSLGSANTDPGEVLRLAEGQPWGPYRIGRLLGRGGMGEVYEAVQADTGRRLALKVLRSRLRSREDRARFLREGELAASISHPHSVYIFGSEEIAGTPVISMELLPGGTLKDRVAATGPLPPAEAASLVLDIIGGLDAAQAGGILHRDIKPSNCFVDAHGSVKVGDFGLSISTLARDVGHDLETTGFQGTPQFAPPEQLRGEPLDLRADIYAVGATLYYLLTGRAPFDARDLRDLFAQVTTRMPPPPRRLRAEVPAGLSSVVMACLAKRPGERPSSYAALAEALEPYARGDEVPARLGARLTAGVIDQSLLALPAMAWRMFRLDISAGATDPTATTVMSLWTLAITVVYFAALEGRFRASIGKRILGLRLSSVSGRDWWRSIAIRLAVSSAPSLALALVVLATGPLPALVSGQIAPNFTLNESDMQGLSYSLAGLLLVGLLFVTIRRHNGWAALHDLASGTRVVARARAARRVGAPREAVLSPAEASSSARRCGPFLVVADVGATDQGDLRVGFDPVLRRRVWIHEVAPGTPEVTPARRDVSRIGRLHWLAGRRSADENWDAFEAPDGHAWLRRRNAAPGWPEAKTWLVDLARELDAATQDGTLPVLELDRLWLGGDGRLVLLDFAAPDATAIRSAGVNTEDAPRPVAFLSTVASHALSGAAAPEPDTCRMPLSARGLIERWSGHVPPTIAEAHQAITRAATLPDGVTRARRAVPVALATAPLAVVILAAAISLPALFQFMNPQNAEMLGWLEALDETELRADSPLRDPAYRDAAERYVVGSFGTVLRDDAYWDQQLMQQLGSLRPTADAILARHPSVSAAELEQATTVVMPEIERRRNARREAGDDAATVARFVVLTPLALFAVLVLGASILSSIVVPGGLLTRMLGLAVVTRAGVEIGRARSLGRVLVAWAPVVAWVVYLASSTTIQIWVPNPEWPVLAASLALGPMLVGAVWTLARPARGPHDRLVRTWVVPR